MKFAIPWLLAIVLGLFLSANYTLAHHSFAAEFDSHQPIALTGTVTRIEWMNPHIYFYLDTKDRAGKFSHFTVQGAAPNMLYRLGWRRDSLKPGDLVTVFGYKSRDGWNRLNARDVVLSDGRKVF